MSTEISECNLLSSLDRSVGTMTARISTPLGCSFDKREKIKGSISSTNFQNMPGNRSLFKDSGLSTDIWTLDRSQQSQQFLHCQWESQVHLLLKQLGVFFLFLIEPTSQKKKNKNVTGLTSFHLYILTVFCSHCVFSYPYFAHGVKLFWIFKAIFLVWLFEPTRLQILPL